MLETQIRQFLDRHPEYAAIAPVVEKEMLHHDIIDVLVKQGAMQRLTFIGGTSLRLCYNSSRLSEDLDFNAGHTFKPSDFNGLEVDIQTYLQRKYETQIWVSKPSDAAQGDTSSWKISIEKQPGRPNLPRQKMHIDVCALPSFDVEKRPLLNHYGFAVPTEGLLIPVQSLAETLADKFIALAYRSRRIKPRDLWDILWIKQRSVNISPALAGKKLTARSKSHVDFAQALQRQIDKLLQDDDVRADFHAEMSRFVPAHIRQRTIDMPDYWHYVQSETAQMAKELLDQTDRTKKFDMGF